MLPNRILILLCFAEEPIYANKTAYNSRK